MSVKAHPTAYPPRSPRHTSWTRQQWTAATIGFMLFACLLVGYAFYLRSSDVAPDSFVGYGFAIGGTLLLATVGVGYALRKRLRRRWPGLLNAALSWHIVGGLLGLALILLHAAGNFHPRTGTYALYSLMALVVSGIVGKLIDRTAPRLAARAALKTLNDDGEERLDALVNDLSARRHSRYDRSQQSAASRREASGIPWDLAYYDLNTPVHEIPELLHRQQAQANQTKPFPAGAEATSKDIRKAIDAESFYLHAIRFWRRLHTVLSVVTLVLILWHLEYAFSLLLGAR